MPYKLNPFTGELDFYQDAGAGGSVASATVSAVSAQAASAINVASNAVSVVSVAVDTVSNALSNLTSIHNVLSNRVSANSGAGGAGSVTSNEVSVLVQVASAAATSADGHAAAASAAATSVEAQARSAVDAASNALSLQIYSVRDAEISNRNSAVQVASAAATSADGHANTVSAAIAAVSVRNSAGTSVKGLQSALNILSGKISDEISNRNSAVQVASAAATSVDTRVNTVSNLLSVLSSQVSVLSKAESVVSILAASAATSNELSVADKKASDKSSALSGADTVISNAVSIAAIKTYTWIISAPATGGTYGAQIQATVKAIKVILATVSASTAITANVEKRPTFGTAGSNILSADITGSATPVSQAADTSAGAATITAGSWLYLDISGTSGSPTVGIVVLQVGAA